MKQKMSNFKIFRWFPVKDDDREAEIFRSTVSTYLLLLLESQNEESSGYD